MASLFYPAECLNDDIWTLPGKTFEERAPLFIECAGKRTTVHNIFAIVIVLIIAIALMFIPFENNLARFIIGGIATFIVGGMVLSIFMAKRSARLTVDQLSGEYNTWKEGQAAADQNIGKFRTDYKEWKFKDTYASNIGGPRHVAPVQPIAVGFVPSIQAPIGDAVGSWLGNAFKTKK
jgi:CDP-diglyceride synthetase